MMTAIWLNTELAAERAKAHVSTIRKALESGELHGSQRAKKGRWRIKAECLDAWAAAEKCKHQSAEKAS